MGSAHITRQVPEGVDLETRLLCGVLRDARGVAAVWVTVKVKAVKKGARDVLRTTRGWIRQNSDCGSGFA